MRGKKVQVYLDDYSLTVLGRLQQADGGATVVHVVRDALLMYDWLRAQTAAGRTVCVMQDGNSKEVVLPFQLKGG